ncbi:MAG: GNAT family N-acetyltransferase [Bdellovibrionota bacterium]
MAEIIYARKDLIPAFHKTLDEVASERIFIEMIEAPPVEKVTEFQVKAIDGNFPVFYAVEGTEVVGWADVFPSSNPRQAHRGFLGMGLRKSHRGLGLGTKLLEAVIAHAKKIGLAKIELSVYSTNRAGIRLYEKLGFEQCGYTKDYRRVDGASFDAISMELFL